MPLTIAALNYSINSEILILCRRVTSVHGRGMLLSAGKGNNMGARLTANQGILAAQFTRYDNTGGAFWPSNHAEGR